VTTCFFFEVSFFKLTLKLGSSVLIVLFPIIHQHFVFTMMMGECLELIDKDVELSLPGVVRKRSARRMRERREREEEKVSVVDVVVDLAILFQRNDDVVSMNDMRLKRCLC